MFRHHAEHGEVRRTYVRDGPVRRKPALCIARSGCISKSLVLSRMIRQNYFYRVLFTFWPFFGVAFVFLGTRGSGTLKAAVHR
jgi:hypothetical protein